MQNSYTLFRYLLLLVALLSACTKQNDPALPDLRTTQTRLQRLSPELEHLRQAFVAGPYAQQLTVTLPDSARLSWEPQWAQTSYRSSQGQPTSWYVPLAQPAVQWVGVRKYLLIRQVGGVLEFNEATFLFDEHANTPATASPSAFFATFTGILRVRNLATGGEFPVVYRQGRRQALAGRAAPTGQATAAQTASCYTMVYCDWTGYCISESTVLVYGAATAGLGYCQSPPEDGVGCSNITWTLTNSNSQTACSPDPPYDPGTPGDPGTPTEPTTPTAPVNTPCQGMKTLSQQTPFQQAEATLIAKAANPLEHGYTYSNSSDASSYVYGVQNSNEISLYLSHNNNMEGTMHTHPPGGLLFFSGTDLQSLYDDIINNRVKDPAAFTITIFGANGLDYAIRIQDLQQFKEFGKAWLENDDKVRMLEYVYYQDTVNGIASTSTTTATREKAALSMLRGEKAGLVVFKQDRNSNNWSQLALDSNNSVLSVPCP
ncbi:hypothetical protein HER32_02810 [Hymenobacter sp. BT18]|uniref:hypothetical protein n=1 Tax=Hymenobacter sp. BT18 TaxID=2835648 RepID=UPI00143E9CCD|nr:hypothetical protein [Hymenobacter sp. BT18]QIX60173.1 hypothetical protein HER32_02810 [Hymenobacter sp. BT18]